MGFLFKETGDPAVAELQITDGLGHERNRVPAEAFALFGSELEALSKRGVRKLDVRISSTGGHANIAIGICDLLFRWPGEVTTRVEIAFSAGSIIAQAGRVRRMAADGLIHTHPCRLRIDLETVPSGIAMFGAADLRRYADACDQMSERVLRIYSERSGRNSSDMRFLVERDNTLNANEAKALGLVDEITAPTGCRKDFVWPEHLSEQVRAARERAEPFDIGSQG